MNNIRKRLPAIVGILVVTGVVAAMTMGVARAWGVPGGFGLWGSQSPSQQRMGYGPGGMMGGNGAYGPGPMMNPDATYGPGWMMGGGGMMGGYGNARNPATTSPVRGNTVTMRNVSFQPANLQVSVGTTVTWTNQESAPHTVTFRDSSLTSSGLLQQGATYTYRFTTAGTFTYYCAVHPTMTGQVTVTSS